MSIQEEIRGIVNKFGIEAHKGKFLLLDERISVPESFVVLLGETSSGKSTLINGLIGSEVLPVGAEPTTGSVTEIMDNPGSEGFNFSILFKNAKEQTIDQATFQKRIGTYDESVLRLRVYVDQFPYDLKYLRLFDTPGYNAINEYHESILRDIVPESDIIIYVVSYKSGFQKYDNDFMVSLGELIDDSTDYFLVVNRAEQNVNENERRVKEIALHASDCLHRELVPYISRSQAPDEKGDVLPDVPDLWNQVAKSLSTDERLSRINITYFKLQQNFLLGVLNDLNALLLEAELTESQKEDLRKNISELKRKQSKAEELIGSRFAEISEMASRMIAYSERKICKEIKNVIGSADKFTKVDDVTGFINSHMLQFSARREVKELSGYIIQELERLDGEINNLLNTAVGKFSENVELLSTAGVDFAKGISKTVSIRIANETLRSFFTSFGGAGGASAGVANAAKAGLKSFGKLFGKTFSRDTHNALAKLISKLGGTSARAIGAAATVIIELFFYGWEVATWQNKLNKNVEQSMNKWKIDLDIEVQKNLSELKQKNLDNVSQFIEEIYSPIKHVSNRKSSTDLTMLRTLAQETIAILNKIDKQLKGK